MKPASCCWNLIQHGRQACFSPVLERVLIHSSHNAGAPTGCPHFWFPLQPYLNIYQSLGTSKSCLGPGWLLLSMLGGPDELVSCHLKGLMCSGCSINMYCLIKWLIFFSSITSGFAFFPLQTSCLYPGPWNPSWYPRTMRWPPNHPFASTLWLRPETTDLPWTSSDVFFTLSLRFFLNPVFHGLTPSRGHLALPPRRDMALTALGNFSYLFFCIDSCVMLGCHDNWLISIQFLDWGTCSYKELQWCLIVCCQ